LCSGMVVNSSCGGGSVVRLFSGLAVGGSAV
jgi:hypothetical protein